MPASKFVTTRSRTPSPFTSAATTSLGPAAEGSGTRGRSVIGGHTASAGAAISRRVRTDSERFSEVFGARDIGSLRGGRSRPIRAARPHLDRNYTFAQVEIQE